jgi:hypothetical protein
MLRGQIRFAVADLGFAKRYGDSGRIVEGDCFQISAKDEQFPQRRRIP